MHDISQLRKRLRELLGQFNTPIQTMLQQRRLARGAVYRVKLRCGKPSCRCNRGQLHEAWMLSVKLRGKNTTRSLSKEQVRTISSLTESYRSFRQAEAQLRRLFGEMNQLVNELEEALCVDWEEVLQESGKE